MYENYYAVIMAGGGGTRLWPLSRQARPKQMVKLLGDRTMFQISIDRLKGLFPPERICVVTVEDQARQLKTQYPEIPAENYILEPEPKNTASVVGLAAIALQKRDPNAAMAILTADHYIGNLEHFHQLLQAAYEVADQEFLVTLGIQPTFPSTGYGYIELGAQIGDNQGLAVHSAVRFLEKPDQELAQRLFESGSYAWNSGMFVWKVDQIIVEIARQMPGLYSGLQQISRAWNSPEKDQVTRQVWSELDPISVDYGIMEGAENVAVVPAPKLEWSDVGSWESLFSVLTTDQEGNIIRDAAHLGLETKDSLIFGNKDERLIVTIGIEDLVIVDTGDVLLVCAKDQAQEVRQVVKILRDQASPLA